MVKMKKISKKMFMVLVAAMMLLGSQTTAFAYVDQGTEATTENDTKKEEDVLEDEHKDESSSFSIPGNGEVLDDISNDSSKEFLTVTTKNNNTFYVVIDRSSATDNVYMLSQIDENDLKEFLDEEPKKEAETSGVVLDENHTVEEATTITEDVAVEEKEDAGVNVGLLSILVLAGAGVGIYYYFKFRKNQEDEDDSRNEGMETDGIDEETINEDDEAEKMATEKLNK